MNKMNAVRVHEAGGAEVLKIEELPVPIIKPGWVLVKVRAFGLNRSELFTRQGHSPKVTFPRVIGHRARHLGERTVLQGQEVAFEQSRAETTGFGT